MLTIDRSPSPAVAPPSTRERATISRADIQFGQVYQLGDDGPLVSIAETYQGAIGRCVAVYCEEDQHLRVSPRPKEPCCTEQELADWLNYHQAVLVGTLLHTIKTTPQLKMRKVTAKDVKPGDVFAWKCLDTHVVARCTKIEKNAVFGVSLDEAGEYEEQQFCGTTSNCIHTLYPHARFELGEAVTDVDGGETTELITKRLDEISVGDVYRIPCSQGDTVFISVEPTHGERFESTVLRLDTTGTARGSIDIHVGPHKLGERVAMRRQLYRMATLLDPKTFEPLTRKVPSKRPAIGADVKPGDLFKGSFTYVRICTGHEDGNLMGVPVNPRETFGDWAPRGVCKQDAAVTLYPNAKLILGAPVTEVEDK